MTEYIITTDTGKEYLLHDGSLTVTELDKRHYGLPEKRKYPMPDRDHVFSAIRFFNYVSPEDEETLAKSILKRMEEFGISEVNVGDANRFKRYYESSSRLAHHGIKGQKWGKWNAETAARYKGLQSGGGGIDLEDDEKDEEEDKDFEENKDSKQTENQELKKNQNLFDKFSKTGMVSDLIIDRENDSQFTKDRNELIRKGLDAVQRSEAAKEAKKAVVDTVEAAKTADYYMRKGDSLTDSERNQMREKVREENKERKRKRREDAKNSGNPLWMFM